MIKVSSDEFQSKMEELIDQADKSREEIEIINEKTNKILGYYVPVSLKKRKLGIWEGKFKAEWVGDGKITLEEFLGK